MKQLPVDEVTNSSSCQSMEAWLCWSDSLLPFKITIIWFVAFQESHENCCHQMPDFKAKIAPNLIWAGAKPQTPLGDPLAGFKGPYF